MVTSKAVPFFRQSLSMVMVHNVCSVAWHYHLLERDMYLWSRQMVSRLGYDFLFKSGGQAWPLYSVVFHSKVFLDLFFFLKYLLQPTIDTLWLVYQSCDIPLYSIPMTPPSFCTLDILCETSYVMNLCLNDFIVCIKCQHEELTVV